MPRFIDLTGQTFNDLTVLRLCTLKTKTVHFVCVCVCGKECSISSKSIRTGHARSCGCGHLRRAKRGQGRPRRGHPLNAVWLGMKARCEKPSSRGYENYGGKGIRVCSRWQVFKNFCDDMGDRPPGTTLDRIDGSGDYFPENCRWTTLIEQNRNKSTNRLVTVYGRSWPMSKWSEISGISDDLIRTRLNRGWPEKLAVFAPSGWRRPA